MQADLAPDEWASGQGLAMLVEFMVRQLQLSASVFATKLRASRYSDIGCYDGADIPTGHFKFVRVRSVKFLHPRGRTT
ncbi:hypothetical protein AOQ72_16890 [Bradyrhizobium yuanmingense]|uniref:Uncharacterized protein n=1 Tax=Bradyrhizobium yuanmingense TaxID=108015 RepID=A0A0R3CUC8_9BRAD|nr:hypothetical protein AOQ72_16890 [Bradyrhizobium yuanmingense]